MRYAKKERNKSNGIDSLIFGLLLVIYTAVMFALFHRQTLGNEMSYHSDMQAYILEMQGIESDYPFPYPLFFRFAALIHLFVSSPQLSVSLALALLNSSSLIILKYYADRMMLKEIQKAGKLEKKEIWIRVSVTVLVFSLFFVSMLYSIGGEGFPGIHRRYLGVFSPNPHHNATYMATRPFAIISFFVFARILQEYEKKINWKDNIIFAVFLFLTTITKPSFTFVLVPAAGLIMLYRLFQKKFQNFLPSLKLGICFLPTFGALLYQFFGVFGPIEGTETGIGFELAKAWKYSCDNIPLAVILALCFPIVMLILNWKELKTDEIYRFSWQLGGMSLLEVLFLYEKGFRLPDMNFSWGYMHGIFFAFAASALLLLKKTWGGSVSKKPWNITLLVGQWVLYGLHLFLGLWYFRSILLGELYY